MNRHLRTPNFPHPGAAVLPALVILVLALLPRQSDAQFQPPRIIRILHSGSRVVGQATERLYVINKGLESNMNKGDIVKVYREKRLAYRASPMRILIGVITIIESNQRSSIGRFTVNDDVLEDPTVRFKVAMKGDFLLPRLVVDSNLLFDRGSAELKQGILAEFKDVADFIRFQKPSKLIIEGHTDSDGDSEYNDRLSQLRAEAVRQLMISQYEFIDPSLLVAKGYGEDRPLVANDSAKNKALNRRIEFVVWWADVEARADVTEEEENQQ